MSAKIPRLGMRKKPGPEKMEKTKKRDKPVVFYINDKELYELKKASGAQKMTAYSRDAALNAAKKKNRRKR